ncbi:MAG: hypothetical protein AAFV38_10905 [Pseudomonadota bacterium]
MLLIRIGSLHYFFKVAFALPILLVAACSPAPSPAPVGDAVAPKFLPSARSLTNTGFLPVPVKTFRRDGSARTEVSGAKCSIKSIYYELQLTTPAVAALPSLGRQTPALRITCTLDGQSQSATATPFNRTRRNAAFISGAIAGAGGVYVATASGSDESQVRTYQPISITFSN